ncbi:hypothetical protein LTR62_007969 [Meristemomyces frigidus]|uniref:Uncharacterized protein n=1 Tax=Meristemomyces frigidus TaxID=1508187 RepID=A0AAN7TUT9_9PEZI|nr:hypothetical protein LTR62_007969 [Meristemomyces frigidus]
MDGDSSRRTADAGASSALKHQDMTEGIHEDAGNLSGAPAGEKTTGVSGSVFDKSGAIGKQFTTEGSIGGTAQSIGGPLDAQGAIGKHFTTGGAIGGSVQNTLGQSEKNTVQEK